MKDVENQNDSPQEDGQPEPLFKSIVVASVVGFAVVSFWRGVWYLWDIFVFFESKLYSALASVITGIIILAVMRTFYSVLAPPIERINIRSSRHQ